MLVSVVIWIIVGAIAGWLSHFLTNGSAQRHLLRDLLIGIMGGTFGFMLRLLGSDDMITGLSLANILTAFMGAMTVLIAVKLLR